MKKTLLLVFVIITSLLVSCSKRPLLTIYMVGDSTMADYCDTISTPIRGWGQVLPTFLDEKVVVKNHAKDSRSTKSFLAEGRWDKVMKKLNKGDVVIIQFGHNDAINNPSLFSNPQQYAENLGLMIRQAKSAGAYPIICTPIAGRVFIGDSLQYIHGEYPFEAKRIAETEETPLVDLTTITMKWLDSLGDERSKSYYVYKLMPGEYKMYPNGKSDDYHLRLNGAVEVAKLFSEAVKVQEIKPLCNYINDDPKGVKYTKPCKIK